MGGSRIGFSANTKIDRKDFGTPFDKKLASGVSAVADEVDIRIDVEAIEVKETPAYEQ
jgi:polyisoprenoid-binding protein YceI